MSRPDRRRSRSARTAAPGHPRRMPATPRRRGGLQRRRPRQGGRRSGRADGVDAAGPRTVPGGRRRDRSRRHGSCRQRQPCPGGRRAGRSRFCSAVAAIAAGPGHGPGQRCCGSVAVPAAAPGPSGAPGNGRPAARHGRARLPRALPAVVPTRVRVPALGVDSDLARLGTDAAGALLPPADFAQAGWFAGGPVPGAVGPAVIAGHVDRPGSGRLLPPGPSCTAATASWSRGRRDDAPFTVTRVARYPKSAFPTAAVYGPTAGPELRLITCGGRFDRSRRSYVDDVVVFARLAEFSDGGRGPASRCCASAGGGRPRTRCPTARGRSRGRRPARSRRAAWPGGSPGRSPGSGRACPMPRR